MREKKKTEISFVFIGRNGKERDKWINAALKQGFKVGDMGEQAPQTITNVLQKYLSIWGYLRHQFI